MSEIEKGIEQNNNGMCVWSYLGNKKCGKFASLDTNNCAKWLITKLFNTKTVALS
jgi:hypothetical protein